MAATDAMPFPIKNTAFRVYFPILDADGDLITGATALDSEHSLDGATFADCSSEATEIATSSGIYYLDLTAAEMNTDCTVVIVKTSTVGAKTTVLTLYPQDTGNIKVDVQSWNGTAVATPDTAGYPKVTVKSGTGTGEVSLSAGLVRLSAAGVDDIWDEPKAGHITAATYGYYLDALVSGVMGGGSPGSGALVCTWTVYDGVGTTPLPGADVWVSTDSAGANVVAGTLVSNASGQVVFYLDAGTYYVWKQLSGYEFTNPETWTVS